MTFWQHDKLVALRSKPTSKQAHTLPNRHSGQADVSYSWALYALCGDVSGGVLRAPSVLDVYRDVGCRTCAGRFRLAPSSSPHAPSLYIPSPRQHTGTAPLSRHMLRAYL